MKKYWLLILLLSIPNWLSANENLDNFLQGLQTLRGQFYQELYNEKGTLLERSQGKMYMQRPDQFRWEYEQPYNQLIVADGKNIFIYDIDLEQVTLRSLDKTIGKTPAFLLSRSRQLGEDFFVNQLSQQEDKTRFELIPKDAQAQFDSIRINLRGNTLQSFELVDNLGQTTYITFRQLIRNKKLDEGLFIFTPPAGIDIIQDN
ncbi:Outer membrane lipoprotein carrier protein LolA [Beggiatoa sp. PS]|nr:Outer membrane lipoprotein carrier protein LolA [Beggiatoa sp. PS]